MTKRSAIIELGKSIIDAEAKVLHALSSSLSESFEHAVQTIISLNPQGRVILSGMGKAGIVGTKISATLASIGIPSFSLHPSEAIHGDLGRFTRADLSLILSNSGETPEILSMLPHLKRIPSPIISITKSKDSALGRHSDIVLELGTIEEAGFLGLAPTSSSLAMMALGDALCMTLAELKGVSREDFASFHPGGDLGKSLMLVKDKMRTDDRLCIQTETTSVKAVLHAITQTKGKPGAAAIINDDGILVGIFTDGDLRRCLEKDTDFLNKPVSSVMGKSPKTITGDEFIADAFECLGKYKVDQLIVINEASKPIGLIDIQDLI